MSNAQKVSEWVMAPPEPTQLMLRAGMDDLGWWVEPCEARLESGVPVEQDMSVDEAARINALQIETVASFFVAMLRAAPTPDAHSEVGDDLVEAAAIAIDRLWSADGTNRDYPFPETELSYQEHCRSTARAALQSLTAGVVKAEPVAVTDEMVSSALAAFYASRGGSDHAYIRANFTELMRNALTAALASKPEGVK